MRPRFLPPPSFALRAGAVLGLAGFVPTVPAVAQTCVEPVVIPANSERAFDTCSGETQLPLACGVFPLAGPATVVLLDLPYPAGYVSIRSLDINFEPTAFLLNADCNGQVPCSVVATVGPDGSAGIDLSPLDSGRYFLVVSTYGISSGPACGPISIIANVTPEQEATMRDGVFRGGNAPIWPQ